MSPSPLRYVPGDRVGVALALDGTAYRDGSVSVETVANLSVGDSELDLDAAARERLLAAVLEITRCRGAAATRRRWVLTLRALEAVGAVGGPGIAGDADCFLAVDGQGDGRRRFEGLDPVPLSDPASFRLALGPDRRAVRVGRDDELGDVLVTVFRAVGVF